jgi:hypothetical protein
MKKRILLSVLAVLANLCVLSAQTVSNGFYRVQNQYTGRYMKVRDNYGVLIISQTDADLKAIVTIWPESAMYDPGTIMYVQQVGDQYNVTAQGTNMYDIIGYYLRLASSGTNLWRIYQTKSGATKYISDEYDAEPDDPYGVLATSGSISRDWYITPVDATTDNYCGIKPTVQVGDKYYASYFAGFAFDLVSDGMKAYYVDETKGNYCHLTEISGTIPAATPVIIECSSATPSENRIQPVLSTAKITNNKLTGVYFDINIGGSHVNQVAYDPNTMRSLGVTENGTLGFVVDNVSYVPQNTFYLKVPAGTAATLSAVEEYPAAGDVDGDGVITEEDVEATVSLILDNIADGEVSEEADANGDGVITVTDITTIVDAILSSNK